MWAKLRSKNSITGIAAICLSVSSFIAQFVLEGWTMQLEQWISPLGFTSLVLFLGGVSLIVFNYFRKELTFKDKQRVVEERQKILSPFRELIHKRLLIAKQLQGKAINLPLEQYWEKYLKHTVPYIITKVKPTKPLEITNALAKQGFMWNNLYYSTLKANDFRYGQACSKYESLHTQIDDNKLKSRLRTLWSVEHNVGSTSIYTSLSVNEPKIPHSPRGIRIGFWGKALSDKTLTKALESVENRISELLEGDDL